MRPWNAAAFALAPNAKVISRVGVGYDNVVVVDATAAGVIVCNTPIAPMVSTAEHTLALMFAVTKHLPHHVDRARQGLKGEPVGRALELDGSVLGLVGIGRIASRVAVAANALGMQVIAADPAVLESPVPGVELVPFDELLATSDVVSVHAPALPSTWRMFDAEAFAACAGDLLRQLCTRRARRSRRPARRDRQRAPRRGGTRRHRPRTVAGRSSVARPANVVVTPHIASASVAGRRRLYEHSIDNALGDPRRPPCDNGRRVSALADSPA